MCTAGQLVGGGTHGWELDAIIQPVSELCKMADILSELDGKSRVSELSALCFFLLVNSLSPAVEDDSVETQRTHFHVSLFALVCG